jgi:hypothetical protein
MRVSLSPWVREGPFFLPLAPPNVDGAFLHVSCSQTPTFNQAVLSCISYISKFVDVEQSRSDPKQPNLEGRRGKGLGVKPGLFPFVGTVSLTLSTAHSK